MKDAYSFDADDESADRHGAERVRARADQRPDRQRHGRREQRGSASLRVRERAYAEAAQETAGDEHGDHRALRGDVLGETEVVGDRAEGRVDHRAVIPEQKRTEARCRDARNETGPNVVPVERLL